MDLAIEQRRQQIKRQRYQDRAIIKQFMSTSRQQIETDFAQLLVGRQDIQTAFVHHNQAFTDGFNIVVDPQWSDLFLDQMALQQTEENMNLSAISSIDPWQALCVLTRGQVIHECLHLCYTKFPSPVRTDPLLKTANQRQVMATLTNIIEDIYIEAVGCSMYDNLSYFLTFLNTALFFRLPDDDQRQASKKATKEETTSIEIQIDPTVLASVDEQIELSADNSEPAVTAITTPVGQILDCLLCHYLYPMVTLPKITTSLEPIWQKIIPLADLAIHTGDWQQRYQLCQRIFEIIQVLIPKDNEAIKLPHQNLIESMFDAQSPSLNHFSNEPLVGQITVTLAEWLQLETTTTLIQDQAN